MLVPLLVSAPWLLGIAWIVGRQGFRLLVPRDDVPASFGEHARRRSVIS